MSEASANHVVSISDLNGSETTTTTATSHDDDGALHPWVGSGVELLSALNPGEETEDDDEPIHPWVGSGVHLLGGTPDRPQDASFDETIEQLAQDGQAVLDEMDQRRQQALKPQPWTVVYCIPLHKNHEIVGDGISHGRGWARLDNFKWEEIVGTATGAASGAATGALVGFLLAGPKGALAGAGYGALSGGASGFLATIDTEDPVEAATTGAIHGAIAGPFSGLGGFAVASGGRTITLGGLRQLGFRPDPSGTTLTLAVSGGNVIVVSSTVVTNVTVNVTVGGGLVASQVCGPYLSQMYSGAGNPSTGAPSAVVPQVSDPKLANYVRDLYKGARGPNPIGTGSTADAVRNELVTGLPTHGTFHSDKAQQYINGLTRWLKNNPNANQHDRLVAKSLLDDLKAALAGN